MLYNITTVFGLFGFVLLPVSGVAQSSDLADCLVKANHSSNAIRQVSINGSLGKGGSVDGGGGIDVFGYRSAGTFLPRPEVYSSIERFDIENGLFNTIVVNSEMIESAELGELEISADWFDQVILDPMHGWSRSVDPAFSSQLFYNDSAAIPTTVRTPLHAFVTGAPEILLRTQEGPLGVFSITASDDPEVIPAEGQSSAITLSWTDGGFITPDLRDLDPSIDTITFDLRNRKFDSIVFDLFALSGAGRRDIIVESDPSDRWIMVQNECWQQIRDDKDPRPTLVFNADQPTEVRLISAQTQKIDQRISIFTQAVVEEPSYRHLSADSTYVLDAVDLRNGGKDVLILRNDQRLRQGMPVFVEGDEDLDEIWIEGSAGWQIQYRDYGIAAVSPLSDGSSYTVALAPGLQLAVLPQPTFLNNPEMLSLPSYPGLPDEKGDGRPLRITRTGFVSFSAQQIADRSFIDMVNGARNVFYVSPGVFADAASDVTIVGDLDLDVILSEDMPEPEMDYPGWFVWQIERPNGGLQTIAAIDFSYIQYRTKE